jgi:pre-rRNA-processing protein TSR3
MCKVCVKTTRFIVIRHRKENLKKCSLRGLENRSDFCFLTYPSCVKIDLMETFRGMILLDIEGEPLSKNDNGPIILLDGTWAYVSAMRAAMPQLNQCVRRKLPDSWRTAYPRYQTACPDPTRGLASIEAIYAAATHMGTSREGLLDAYYWKDQFLALNAANE